MLDSMSVIRYEVGIQNLREESLEPFCVGWKVKPSPANLKRALANSYRVVLALDGEKLLGFCNAVSDGVLSAYIPLLEVLPEAQGQGLGTALMKRMLEELGDHYMVDLLCDRQLVPYYNRFGMQELAGMGLRNCDALSRLAPAHE